MLFPVLMRLEGAQPCCGRCWLQPSPHSQTRGDTLVLGGVRVTCSGVQGLLRGAESCREPISSVS